MVTDDDWGSEPCGWEKGAITAEFATTLPAVMVLLAVVIALAAAFGTQFRVSDAARAGARLFAINDDKAGVNSLVAQLVGGQPNVDISQNGPWATVRVEQSLRVGPIWLHPFSVSASATGLLERCLPPGSCQ